MTNKEAIETIKIAIAEVEWYYPMEYAIAFETAIEALEKQIPKKPTDIVLGALWKLGKCPVCGRPLNSLENLSCPKCLTLIDWGEDDV